MIIPKNKCKYLGQLINNNGLTENVIEIKIFGQLIGILNSYNGFTKTTKIRIFKTYLISKVNHLLPLISLSGNLEISWKTIRKIIFRNILNKQTTPLETMIALGIGYYNIIIRPLIKLIGRYNNLSKNEDETKYLKEAANNAISYWLQTEKKHTDPETLSLQKIILGELWLNEKEMDQLLYNNLNNRLMRNNSNSLNLMEPKILRFPNLNYNLSNAPYHEIIDTALTYEKTETDKLRQSKYERMVSLTKHLLFGKEITALLLNPKQNQIHIPIHSDLKNIEEDMILLEAEIQMQIENKKIP